MTVRLHVDPAALARLAQSEGIQRAMKRAGGRIADEVRKQGVKVGDVDEGPREIPLPVRVEDDGTVLLAHPSGIAVQAKHGALTRAAAAAGYEVHG